jgi:hypothetical protein
MADFRRDNPGGDWLKRKQEQAGEHFRGHKLSGAITGYFKHTLHLPVKHLTHIPGANGEHKYRDDHTSHKHQELAKSVKEKGFNTEHDAILIGVNHHGEPHVLEGNHRLAHAAKHGIEKIHAEVRYWNGGEDAKGNFTPKHVASLHDHGEPMKEEVAANAISGGGIAMFDPLLKVRKKKMSDMVRRWMQGR